MPSRRFIQCDVFTPTATAGNPLAVVVDARDLSGEQMQRFAAWTNLAETTFLLPPDQKGADYRVRIFTPVREMLFAGHPTLGSCAAWLHCGGQPARPGLVRQQCAIGIVDIDTSDAALPAFVAPPTEIKPMSAQSLDAICAALDIDGAKILRSAVLENGPVFQVMQLDCAQTVLELDASRVRWPGFKSLGFIGAHTSGAECAWEVRHLAPSSGMSEDPITGSLNSALAHWLQAEQLLGDGYIAAQGTVIDRVGRVHVSVETDGRVKIGGQTHILVDGSLEL